ncbi:MAG: sugar phosphate isomerase/epimerase [Eubacterium sp.]|nr:sugar phosphate isomerase/epimerase [Eubacterium sp.]MBR1673860.1 sugar phosphate isomerase/epimerase [Eubacterium sp.]
MQLGLRLHDARKLPLSESLRDVKAQGFSCVHLALSKIEGQTSDIDALTPGYAMYLRHEFENAGLDIAVLGNYLNLAHPDKDKLKEIQRKYMAHLRFASLLGCSVVGTETGAPNPTYSYDKESCHSREALEIFIENVKPVVEYAEKCGVILAIEPVYKHIVYNPERAREVLDRIASPNLQIIFDPVNLLHPDNLDRRDEVISEAIELLGPDISIIHLKDYVLEGGEMNCLGCGLGEMDYDSIVKFAVTKKPYIQATLENTKPENAVSCREYIAGLEKKYM